MGARIVEVIELVEGESVHGAGVVWECFEGVGSFPCSWLFFDRGSRRRVGIQGGRGRLRSRMVGVHSAGVTFPLRSDVGREEGPLAVLFLFL